MVSFVPPLLEDSWREKRRKSGLPQLHNPVIYGDERKCCYNSVKKSIKKDTNPEETRLYQFWYLQ